MKRTPLLILIIAILAAAPFFAPRLAHAAKMHVHWIPPTTNTDGSPLTDLAGFRVEWGSCNADGSFGKYQAGVNAPPTATSADIYPTGLAKVCAHVFAYSASGTYSDPSNTAFGTPPPTLSQPVH